MTCNVLRVSYVRLTRKQNVDVAIPANNKGRSSIGLMSNPCPHLHPLSNCNTLPLSNCNTLRMYWMLCREVLRLRGTVKRSQVTPPLPHPLHLLLHISPLPPSPSGVGRDG